MFLHLPYRLLATPLVFLLAGCVNARKAEQPMMMADHRPMTMADQPIKSYAEIVKGFDQTLTEAEKRRVLAELRKSKERSSAAGKD
jgi:hypothetical protein